MSMNAECRIQKRLETGHGSQLAKSREISRGLNLSEQEILRINGMQVASPEMGALPRGGD